VECRDGQNFSKDGQHDKLNRTFHYTPAGRHWQWEAEQVIGRLFNPFSDDDDDDDDDDDADDKDE
jgi:hypothetical protein